jgi:hypothetical protein
MPIHLVKAQGSGTWEGDDIEIQSIFKFGTCDFSFQIRQMTSCPLHKEPATDNISMPQRNNWETDKEKHEPKQFAGLSLNAYP